ncbi:hypothetical protein TR75_07170 [Hydrogenibacillus schlegelii]|uniref:Uncharacterized protein n=1 Tax=Hydrogenibacillus schlegelii TaxID=1484 RepID=A0A132N7C1_HYDSH|nr:hypothetical protein TR75_07170 [Hydrogenibacillus schlegelii]OAR04322.1 hypothetical protein SA87_05140 [Hydrogenibacillus schlegelii]
MIGAGGVLNPPGGLSGRIRHAAPSRRSVAGRKDGASVREARGGDRAGKPEKTRGRTGRDT